MCQVVTKCCHNSCKVQEPAFEFLYGVSNNVEQLWNSAIRDSPGDCNQTCGCVCDVYITTRLLPQPVYHSWGMRWMAGSYSNINKSLILHGMTNFIKMGFFAARKGVTMVNQMAASRCMGLIRTLEMRLKRELATDWNVFAIIAENSLFSADRKKGNHKTEEGGGERKDGCHLKQANLFSKESNPGQVLYQLGGVCMVCVCVGERIRDELALINKPAVAGFHACSM